MDVLQRQLQLAVADVRELGARLAAAQLEVDAGGGGEASGMLHLSLRVCV